MAWQYTPVTPLLIASLVVSLGLAAFLLVAVEREGRRRVVFGLVGMLLGSAYWSTTALVKLSRTELSAMVVAEQLHYVGGTTIILSWYVFAAAYTDREAWLRPRRIAALATLPVIGTALSLTNGSHQLLWTAAPRVVDQFVTLELTHRPLFFFFMLGNYLVILLGMYALARLIVGPRQLYRGQAAALIGSAAVPTAANAARLLDLGPWPGVDLSPIAFAVSGALLVFAITRYEFLDVEPVARRQVVQRMRDGFVVLDEHDRVVDLNPAAADLLGIDADAAVGQGLAGLVPEIRSLVADGGATGSTEFTFGDRNQRHLQARLAPIDRAAEPADSRLLLLQDVTDRHRVERRYQQLVEKSSDVVFVLDADATITYVTPAIRNVLDTPAEAVRGRSALEFVHREDHDRLADLFERSLDAPETTVRFEFRFRSPDGDHYPVEAVGRNLLEDPFVEGMVVNVRDITERKERERRLQRQNERLDRFASVVSHDLRNPLEVARGHLELAREGDREGSLGKVEAAHDRMERIIDDVLTLAREGQAVTETEPVDLAAASEQAWAVVEAGRATLAVEDAPTVEADPDRLGRLLENLFRNSVEHGPASGRPGDTREGDPGLTVSVGACEGGFYVADDGQGLGEAGEEIFEFGYSEDGTGIGLAVVADIAEAHGWTVRTAESHAGGARFEFVGVDGRDAGDGAD